MPNSTLSGICDKEGKTKIYIHEKFLMYVFLLCFLQIGYTLHYIVGPKVHKSPSKSASGEQETQKNYEEALKDIKIKWMK